MARPRSLAFALAMLLISTAGARGASAQPAPAEVKTHMDAADKASKAKDWEKAVIEYRAAFDAGHGSAALEGAANALYELKHVAEAYEAYDELLRSFGDTLGRRKATAEARHKELAVQTGTVLVKVSENGAAVSIDDKPVGTSPIPVRHVAA